MAIFDKEKVMANQGRPASPAQINMLGEGTVVEGTLHTDNDIRVSGKIVGTLRVDGKAIIAKEGSVEGELEAVDADVAGNVEGEVRVGQRLVLQSSSHIDGNITTNRLVVEEGAVITGKCMMGDQTLLPTFGADRQNGEAGATAAAISASEDAVSDAEETV